MKVFLLAALLLASVTGYANQSFEAPLKLQPFALKWMNAEEPDVIYNTEDHPNAIFILEAYFKNCPYCNDNAPNVDALREYYADNALVQVLDVGRDCRISDYRAWIQRHNPNHPVLNDCNMEVLGALGTSGYPTTYVTNCQLEVKKKYVGSWGSRTFNEITRYVDSLLERGCQ